MKYYSIQEICDLAKQELPVKYTDLEIKVKQYHDAVYKELVYGYYLANMDQINQGVIPFNITRLRKKLGRYGKGGKGYWWDWLHLNFPLVSITSKGNSIKGVSSMAEPIVPLDIILASGSGKELIEALYSTQDLESDIDFAPINVYSLNNYVQATAAENNINPTIQKNLKDARIILAIARECDNQLPQVASKSKFGRTYYKGINLQNIHKTVRHAALGACYEVDINSSVFNWKYAVVPFRDELTYTRELIQDKTRIRKHLAQVVFGNTTKRSTDTVKRVLTAISFGARAETRSWFKTVEGVWTQGAVSEIIYSKDVRDTLFNDPWMREFMREQDRINKYIGEDLACAAREGVIPQHFLEDLKSERGRISKAKLIAWAYQQSEQQVMALILKEARSEVVLQVHDGVYFRTKPDMPSMQTVLQEHWPLATLSIQQIENYAYHNRELDQQHVEHIQREERAANNGVLPATHGIHSEHVAQQQYNPHAEPDWENVNNLMEEYYSHFPNERPCDPNMPEFARRRLH